VIGERLAEIRKDHSETQADLAEQLGVSLPTVRAWEQEKSSPSHEMLVVICRRYSVSSDYLLGLSDMDPVYIRQRRSAQFTKKEMELLQEYEEFLLWKKRRTQTK